MIINYKPKGICAIGIGVEVENGIVNNVRFTGGCEGNHDGINRLVQGMKVDDVIRKLEGIKCGNKKTSCPDQLAQALKTI